MAFYEAYIIQYSICTMFVLTLYFVVNIAILVFNVYCCFLLTPIFIKGNN